MGMYITRSSLEDHFGATNVREWADSERNDETDPAINRAIETAIGYAEGILHAALMRGRYVVPIQYLDSMATFYIQGILVDLAGFRLYTRRGLQDAPIDNKLAIGERRARDELSRIQSGEMVPGIARKTEETDAPFVVTERRTVDARNRNIRRLGGF